MNRCTQTVTVGPLSAYNQLVESGSITFDQGQYATVKWLQCLYLRIVRRSQHQRKSVWQWFTRKKNRPLRGVYLWGGVGCGKTTLMDLFFHSLELPRKRRIHFHAFMRDIHERVHKFRETGIFPGDNFGISKKFSQGGDPLPALAELLSHEVDCLCLDELQVTDIADAMVLTRLFEYLFKHQVLVLATSNRHPDQLYKNGLNRQLFIPFIHQVMQRLKVTKLGSDVDYRLQFLANRNVYFYPLTADNKSAMDQMFAELTVGSPIEKQIVHVNGRQIEISQSAQGCARVSFAELCVAFLGASDYIEISRCFHTVFLDDIPKMGMENQSEARRFVTLVDALYEHKVKLIASSEVSAEYLYTSGSFSFEFERTVSRLQEMKSLEYLHADHIP